MLDASRPSALPETLQTLARELGRNGEKDAVLFFDRRGERRCSYRSLAEDARRLATGLAERGIAAGDAVVVCARNRPEWIIATFASLRHGAVLVPLDTQLDDEAFRHALADSGARLLFTTAGEVSRLREACRAVGVEIVLLEDEDGEEPSWRGLLSDATGPGDLRTAKAEETAVLFYTSGTTGPAKGVPLTHRNLVFQIRTIAEADLVRQDERVLLPLPLHHVYPFVVGMLAPLALGLPLILPSAFTGSQVLQALQQGRATMMMGVPRLYEALIAGLDARLEQRGRLQQALFNGLLDLGVFARRQTGLRLGKFLLSPLRRRIAPDLRIVVSGGAALGVETGWRLEGLGWLVATGYGLTETSPLLTMNPPGNLRFDTAGRPVPGVELRIDPGGAPEGRQGEGDIGEVLARGPGVFRGYHNLPDKTAEAFTHDGWFRTGDLGRIDSAGFLHLAGRRSTMIVTASGENVQPDTVEEAYQKHPAIGEIAVLERDGKIVGLIVPAAGADAGTNPKDTVRKAVAEVRGLPSYQRLAEFAVTRETIPRTRLGKPRRHLLPELYERALRGEAGAAPERQGPMPLDDMSAEDRALLEDPAARQAWGWLAARYADRRLSPDSDLTVDLGIDSMDWLNISLEMSQRTGVDLTEDAIARVRTVRDLLTELTGGGEVVGAARFSLDEPEAALDEEARRWLRPLDPASRGLSLAIYWLNRAAMRLLFRVRCSGLENLPGEGPFVITPNHSSLLDPLALGASLEYWLLRRTYWAGWTGIVFSGPVRRRLARLAQAVPIDPRRGAASSLAFAAAILKRKMTLVWFPEGRRSDDGTLQAFMPGLGLLLEHYHSVPVVPVVIRGAYEAWPRSRSFPRPKRIEVQIHPPLSPEHLEQQGSGNRPSQRILDALHAHMSRLLQQPELRQGGGPG
jgi:long-chain acyl-CoA synthetase